MRDKNGHNFQHHNNHQINHRTNEENVITDKKHTNPQTSLPFNALDAVNAIMKSKFVRV